MVFTGKKVWAKQDGEPEGKYQQLQCHSLGFNILK